MTAGLRLILGEGAAATRVRLDDYLDDAAEEAAREAERDWIKAVRLARVDGEPFRQRFTFRGDSLWWFAELYLHKQQVILRIVRALGALDRVMERDAPRRVAIEGDDPIAGLVATRYFTARGVVASGTGASPESRVPSPESAAPGRAALVRMDARSTWLHGSALLSRLRTRPAPTPRTHPTVLAFLHQAFVRGEHDAAGGEAYIGPVLRALEARLPEEGVQYVGVGPASNFRARRWWHPVARPIAGRAATPIERYAPLARLKPSRAVWGARHASRRSLLGSADLRQHAVIRGCDCWPLVAEELAGIALLQWPWSARAMDEAGAALDALQPEVAITYAEAGGWGRAIVLEARRRGIPTAGLQHGFIYRHWLNYRHEPDEMTPPPSNDDDCGFPYPTSTLLFDGFAAHHLREAGRFPAEALRVTGSPRLDELTAAVRTLPAEAISGARLASGAASGEALVLVVTKYREASSVLPGFLDTVADLPDVRVVIKTHPAETPDVYAPAVAGRARVSVLPAAAPLAPLLNAARLVVTVNSTVALDAAVLGVPGLVLGLPNNLTPFVDAGALAAGRPATLGDDLRQILYNEQFRQDVAEARRAVLDRWQMAADGTAASRTADAVLELKDDRTGA